MRIFFVLTLFFGCLGSAISAFADGNTEKQHHGIQTANIDKSCAPCQDFYQFANGVWLKNTEIPAEYGSWGTFHILRERNRKILREIVEQAAQNTSENASASTKMVGDFFYSGMDTERIEAAGAKPIQADLERIAAIKTVADLQTLINTYHAEGLDLLFGFTALQDLKDNQQVIAYITQGGLGLPDRDYYTKEDEDSVKMRGEYVEHISRMLQLLGDSEAAAKAQAQTIMAMETRLAEVSLTNVELRNPNAYYNILSTTEADKETPNFSWTRYFKDLGKPNLTSFSFAHPKFLGEMNRMLNELSLDDWKSYLRWHLVNQTSRYLSSAFVDEGFKFQQLLTGAKAQEERWKRVLAATEGALGEVVGQLYVESEFPPSSKKRALEMIDNLRAALAERLSNLEWMSEETKKMALVKADSFTAKIGYPDVWLDYSSMQITRDSYLSNVRQGGAWDRKRNLAKIGKPVDKTEWSMTPQMINAYYNPLQNEIVFPAGILQPPFFDGEADDAVNYGAIGAVIGHELMHGFDDQGSQFDSKGELKNWWTDSDRQNFEARTQKLVEQFNQYKVPGDLNVNGSLTLGENIADLGGMIISYQALQKALQGKERTKIDGFTPEQRFFLAWAQGWCVRYRDESLKSQVKVDPHSPAMYRGNGPLTNIPEFFEAFGCKPGDAMVNDGDKFIKIW